jgi:hypothetical protein
MVSASRMPDNRAALSAATARETIPVAMTSAK